MANLRTLFGKRLRKIRRSRDLTQESLAEILGISVEFISNMERGVNAPSFETIEKLAQAFDLPFTELFNFEDINDGSNTKI
ncbi:MAG: helix-turn-helix domain-containing protein [Aridibacter sp.]